MFAVQLARLAGARVIGTGSATSADFLRGLGAEPVAYGDGLADRVRALAPGGVTAAIDLYGTETAQAARELGVPDARITTIAAQVDGITPANGANAAPGALEEIARLVAAGRLRVPIAASFPVEQIRAAVELQAGRHVHGKVVIDLRGLACRVRGFSRARVVKRPMLGGGASVAAGGPRWSVLISRPGGRHPAKECVEGIAMCRRRWTRPR